MVPVEERLSDVGLDRQDQRVARKSVDELFDEQVVLKLFVRRVPWLAGLTRPKPRPWKKMTGV